ncbi:serine racemase VanT catalytic subunit [Paenibacillus aquistagni]|uniref:serine racemase VanT catalytic subunit n=1 Tax=Paenibacillus aquistagni TaxID=1852522 RepID=UPI0030B89902
MKANSSGAFEIGKMTAAKEVPMAFALPTVPYAARGACIEHWKPDNKLQRSDGYRAWAEINLAHLKQNAAELKRRLPDACSLMAVVKANAYGHGSVPVAKCLQSIGIHSYAVAEIREGIALRKAGIRGEILVLGYTSPGQFEDLCRYGLTQTVIQAEYAIALNQYGKKMKVHVKFDTGMGRLGERADQVERTLCMYRQPNLLVTGTYSHLSVPDSDREEDIDYTKGQIRRFYHLVDAIKSNGLEPGRLHLQSSYGMLLYPELDCDLARPGIALYGAIDTAAGHDESTMNILPVLSLKARVTMIKRVPAGTHIGYGRRYKTAQDSLIATVSIGYADGIPRCLFEQGGYVLVRGQRAAIAGNICMDQMMIDATHLDHLEEGDVVTLIGQDGDCCITAIEVATRCHTIPNELLTGIGSRVDRVYLD